MNNRFEQRSAGGGTLRVLRVLRGLSAVCLTLASGLTLAQTGSAPTPQDIADLAPLLPRPAGADDETLSGIAPPLVLSIAAERLHLAPAAAIATAGQRLSFRLSLREPGANAAGPQTFVIEQWLVDGVAGGNATLGSIVNAVAPGVSAAGPVSEAIGAYVAPARLPATREVTVTARVRFGPQARHRVEVLARVLLLAGPAAVSVTWETQAENLQAAVEHRGRGAEVDDQSSIATTRHSNQGALTFPIETLAVHELGAGKRIEVYAEAGFAQAQAIYFQRAWRKKQNTWCDERSSFVQAASGQARLTVAAAGASQQVAPRLRLQRVDGGLRVQFQPPSLRIDSTLEDANTYSRRCRSGGGGNDEQHDASKRAWNHSADNVAVPATAALQRQDDGSWQWSGSVPNPVNNDSFRQHTRYRINVRPL